MMDTTTIELNSMHISNFKGLPALDVEFGPGRTDIYGDNATGKTTIFDAFTWLLFGKDSHNQTMFNIKPLASTGDVAQHGAVSGVEAVISVNDKTYELRKEYKEDWKKKRGSANPVFSGHSTKYFIDGVPKTKTEYNRFIQSISDEATFRLVTSPEYFSSVLDWKTRRDVLMQLGAANALTDQDIVNESAELEPLRPLLEQHSHEDLMKKLKADRTRVNKERAELPVRIDEARRSVADTAGIDEAKLIADRDHLQKEEAEISRRITDLQNGQHSSEMAELSAKIIKLRENEIEERSRILQAYETAKAQHIEKVQEAAQVVNELERMVDICAADAKDIEKRMDALRAEFKAVAAEKWTDVTVCPTCGQAIPEDQVAEKRAAFNLQKSKRKEAINKEGKELKAKVEALNKNEATGRLAISEKKEEYLNLKAQMPVRPDLPAGDSDEIKALIARRDALANADTARQEIEAQQSALADVRHRISDCNAQLAKLAAAKDTVKRIAELEDQEKTLSQEIERIDMLIDLGEKFIRTKVHIMEDRINSSFELVEWRLFREQINGGIEECCDLTVNGVPWDDLNSAMRINAGLDVVRTLSGYNGLWAPVFVDNAETVTSLDIMNEMEGQLIRLVVSEPDKTLRVEAVA